MPLNHFRKTIALLGIGWMAAASIGCHSIRSTLLTRDESNSCWMTVKHLKGVPITLKVPTHLRVSVVEQHFLTQVSAGGITKWERVEVDVPLRVVTVDTIKTEKIFTVDFVRPAAGTLDLTLEMQDKEQYFSKIQDKVVDETINDVSNLISKVAPGGLFKPAASDSTASLTPVNSIVATEIFEVDDPMLEIKLNEFLKCHINKSHDAWVAPPGVDSIRRVDLNNSHLNPTDQLCPTCDPMVNQY